MTSIASIRAWAIVLALGTCLPIAAQELLDPSTELSGSPEEAYDRAIAGAGTDAEASSLTAEKTTLAGGGRLSYRPWHGDKSEWNYSVTGRLQGPLTAPDGTVVLGDGESWYVWGYARDSYAPSFTLATFLANDLGETAQVSITAQRGQRYYYIRPLLEKGSSEVSELSIVGDGGTTTSEKIIWWPRPYPRRLCWVYTNGDNAQIATTFATDATIQDRLRADWTFWHDYWAGVYASYTWWNPSEEWLWRRGLYSYLSTISLSGRFAPNGASGETTGTEMNDLRQEYRNWQVAGSGAVSFTLKTGQGPTRIDGIFDVKPGNPYVTRYCWRYPILLGD